MGKRRIKRLKTYQGSLDTGQSFAPLSFFFQRERVMASLFALKVGKVCIYLISSKK